jgi:hypothetical protein
MEHNGGPAEQHINFRGIADCKPIPYEDIALNRDVVFLRHYFYHTGEDLSGGAPELETRYYTRFLTQRDGLPFLLCTIFSCWRRATEHPGDDPSRS